MPYLFSELVVIPEIQQILSSFYSCCGVTAEILEVDNQVIVASSDRHIFNKFQQDILSPKQGCGLGEEKFLPEITGKSSKRYECLGGCFKYARAIRVENQDIATLRLGPVFHEPADEDKLCLLAQESGLEVAVFLQAVREVQVVTQEQVEGYLEFLVQFIQYLAEKGHNKLRLTETITVIQAQQEKLQRDYHELEAHIRMRTKELERANSALQDSEQHFRVALVDTPVVVFNQDLDLRYTWIYNPQNLGDQPIVGKTDADLFSAEDTMRLTALKKKVIASGVLTRETVSVTVDNRTLFFDMTLDPLYDANGAITGLTCAATDITVRKQIEDTLRQANAGLVRAQKQIEQILQALQSASGSLELDSVLENVLNAMVTAVEADDGSIYLIDKEDDKLVFRAVKGTPVISQGNGQSDQPALLPEDSFLAAEFNSGETLICLNAKQEPGLDQPAIQSLGIKSLLAVPLIIAERVLGVAVLYKTKDLYSFDQEEIELAQGIAYSVALAVENARLYEEMRRSLAESEGLQRIAKGLLKKSGLDEVLEIVCAEAMQLTGAKGSAVLLLDEDGWLKLTHWAGFPEYNLERLPVEGSIAGRAVQTGSHIWVNRQKSDPQKETDPWQGYPWIPGLFSMLSVPLKVDMQAIGVLNILNKPGEITQEDLRIIDLFADQAAIIIEHVRLLHQAEQFAVLEERQRLARELHDSVTQALYSLTLYADAARMAFTARKWDALEGNLQEVLNMAREAMYDMRLLVFELRPFMLEKEGLVSALRARLAAVEGRAGLKTEVLVEGERRLPLVVEEEIYRIAQEGLNNVVKHAKAGEVQIHLKYGKDTIQLEMIDDGLGFDTETASHSGGLGLRGIQERAIKLGGSLEIESASGKGTRLTVKIPVGE